MIILLVIIIIVVVMCNGIELFLLAKLVDFSLLSVYANKLNCQPASFTEYRLTFINCLLLQCRPKQYSISTTLLLATA